MEAHQLTHDAGVRHSAGALQIISAGARRTLDVIVALVVLIVLAPLLLLIALAIRLESSGPALFRQCRLGRDMREFSVNKFRTMRAEADPTPHREYVRALIRQAGGPPPRPKGRSNLYKLAFDDRITRVGRFLRRYSLDELPQLWNVLRGQMSLVGPRPVIPYEVEQYPPDWHERFVVKPGLTGLWQVSGRNEKTYEEMVRLDIDYARKQALVLDAVILAKTAWVVARGKGAA